METEGYKGYKDQGIYNRNHGTGEEKCELIFKLTNGYIGYLDKSTLLSKPNS